MNNNQGYLDMCYELGLKDLEGVTLHWNRNARIGNYITVDINGEDSYEIHDPIRMEKLASITREMYRSKEDVALEDLLWQS